MGYLAKAKKGKSLTLDRTWNLRLDGAAKVRLTYVSQKNVEAARDGPGREAASVRGKCERQV